MPEYPDDDRPDPSHFMNMTRVRDGETNRPDDYLPGTDPFADAEKKKQKAQKKFASADYSGSSRVGDWLGGCSPAKAKRSWKVKEPTKTSGGVDNDRNTDLTPTNTSGPALKNFQNTTSPTRRWKPPPKENSIPPPWMSAATSSSSSSPSKPVAGSSPRTLVPPKWKIERPSQVPPPVNKVMVESTHEESSVSKVGHSESTSYVDDTEKETKPVDVPPGPEMLQQGTILYSTLEQTTQPLVIDDRSTKPTCDVAHQKVPETTDVSVHVDDFVDVSGYDDYEVDSDEEEGDKISINDIASDVDSIAEGDEEDNQEGEIDDKDDDNEVYEVDSAQGKAEEESEADSSCYEVESETEEDGEEERCEVVQVDDEVSRVVPCENGLGAGTDDDCCNNDEESYERESGDEEAVRSVGDIRHATNEGQFHRNYGTVQVVDEINSKPSKEITDGKTSDDVEVENAEEGTGRLPFEIETKINLEPQQSPSPSQELIKKATSTTSSVVDESVYPEDDRPDPREFMIMTKTRDGETDRPDDYLPGTDPFADYRRKKEKLKKKYAGADNSGKSRVDDWLGSGTKPRQRSWQIKTS